MTPSLDTGAELGASQFSGIRASWIRFGPTNRVGPGMGCHKLVVSEHLGFGSDPPIRSDRGWGVTTTPELVTIYCNRMAALAYAKDPNYHGKTKHIQIRYHFVKDMIA